MGLSELGLLGLFCGAFLSATVIPFPSDVLVLGAYGSGYSVPSVLFIAIIGNSLGAFTNYYIGRRGNNDRLKKKFNLSEDRLARWEKRLAKWGVYLGLLTWIPFIGEALLATLGFFKVKFMPLALFVVLGILFRYGIVTLLYFSVI